MNEEQKTPATAALTDMIFNSFRLHGQLIAFGDQIVKEFRLTSARWQILGSISIANTDVTVPGIARNLGLSRQAVQRVANDLERDGFVVFGDNPDHKRAKLVLLTDMGRRVHMKAERKYLTWANANHEKFKISGVLTAMEVMQALSGCCTTYLQEAEKETEK